VSPLFVHLIMFLIPAYAYHKRQFLMEFNSNVRILVMYNFLNVSVYQNHMIIIIEKNLTINN